MVVLKHFVGRYLDTIVIKHNKRDLVGCMVKINIIVLFCGHVYFFASALPLRL